MTTLQKLRLAEREGDWLKVKLHLVRLGLVKDMGGQGCPHCAVPMTGAAAWPDNMSREDWIEFFDTYIKGYVYRCAPINGGCDGLYITRSPLY